MLKQQPAQSLALDEWIEKTNWVQEQIGTFPLTSLGKHRADMMHDEIVRLRAEVARLNRGQFVISQCVHNMVVAEQSAWIEWQHGAGAEQAMSWIHNGLVGPGHIPKHEGMTAQAYFDAHYDDRMEPSDPRQGGQS